ncbi:MAG: hypothetical protein JW725_01560 [Candidatus Babeliaceae bacterium]|nr:hypothetical protein [Candidatus Babeliaceae bacterium]
MEAHHPPRKKKLWTAGSFLPLITAFFFLALFGIALYRLYQGAKDVTNTIIANDVEQLASILRKIDATCGIISFDREKSYLDFLNVKGFTGSEVGPINLAYPGRWEGPYIADNPTIQGRSYAVVKTTKGYFVVPGDGITLSNGRTIGKDIIINGTSDIPAMMRDRNALLYRDRPLAAAITVSGRPSILLNPIAQKAAASFGE